MNAKIELVDPKQFIHLNMSWSMLNKLAEVQEKKKFENRTQTINWLLDMAIKILDKIENTPPDKLNNEMEEVDMQLKHGGLVDYATKLSGKELRLIFEIIKEEYQTRGMK